MRSDAVGHRKVRDDRTPGPRGTIAGESENENAPGSVDPGRSENGCGSEAIGFSEDFVART